MLKYIEDGVNTDLPHRFKIVKAAHGWLVKVTSLNRDAFDIQVTVPYFSIQNNGYKVTAENALNEINHELSKIKKVNIKEIKDKLMNMFLSSPITNGVSLCVDYNTYNTVYIYVVTMTDKGKMHYIHKIIPTEKLTKLKYYETLRDEFKDIDLLETWSETKLW